MIEKLLLIFVIIEAVSVTYNIIKSVMDVIATRNLTKAQQKAVEGQRQAIKIQEEQYKLNKFYSEQQDEQNENIKHLAYLITDHGSRLNELEKRLTKKPAPKKSKETK